MSMTNSINNLISVIIPTFNGLEWLLLLLGSLKNQSIQNFEIIIVDDGGSDGTGNAVTEVIKDSSIPIRYYYLDNAHIFGAGIARNYGAKQAKGEILIFLDQDCVADIDLLSKHKDQHKSKDIILGYYAAYGNDKECYDCLQLRKFVQQKQSVPMIKEFRDSLFCNAGRADVWKCFVSAHFSIKKEIFDNICFDESFTQWGCEDVDLGYRLFLQGNEIYFVRDCLVYNSSQGSMYSIKKLINLSESLIQLYSKHPIEEIKLYCLERFYHTPVKYRKSWQLMFENGELALCKLETDILINANYDAIIFPGKDFERVKGAIEDIKPLTKSIRYEGEAASSETTHPCH